jgi:hypothetical protein
MEIRVLVSMFGLYYGLMVALHGAVAMALYAALYGRLPEDPLPAILFIASGGIAGIIGSLLLWLASRY